MPIRMVQLHELVETDLAVGSAFDKVKDLVWGWARIRGPIEVATTPDRFFRISVADCSVGSLLAEVQLAR